MRARPHRKCLLPHRCSHVQTARLASNPSLALSSKIKIQEKKIRRSNEEERRKCLFLNYVSVLSSRTSTIASSMKITEKKNKKYSIFSLSVFRSFFFFSSHFIFHSLLRHHAQSTIKHIYWVDTSTEWINQPKKRIRKKKKKNWLLMHLFSSDERCARVEPKIRNNNQNSRIEIHASYT